MRKLRSCRACRSFSAGFDFPVYFQTVALRTFALTNSVHAACAFLYRLFLELTKEAEYYDATPVNSRAQFPPRQPLRRVVTACEPSRRALTSVLQHLLNPWWPTRRTALRMERNAKWPLIKHSSIPPRLHTTDPNCPPHPCGEQLRSLQSAVKTCDRFASELPGLRAVKTRTRRERNWKLTKERRL